MSRSATKRHSWRLWILGAGLLVVTAGFSVRLFWLQVVDHDHYVAEAEEEHAGYRKVYAPRGAIVDRHGNPLASSIDTFDIFVNRPAWRDEARANDAAGRLAEIVDIPAAEILETVETESQGDQLILRELDYERGQAIIDAGIPGVKAVPASRRIYPEGDLASVVLGFVGKDQVGLAGLEADYDDALAGEPGSAVFERDSFGNEIVIGRREVKPPKPGADLVLTIDRYLQRLVEEELDAALEQHQATGGAIIIQDPTTGAILAMAVRPSFSLLNLDLSDPANEDLYRNRAVTDLYEPGSVFKLVTIAAAIDHGAVTPETPYYDSGLLVIGDSEIRNWNEQGYGTQTIRQVLQNSLNLGSAFAAQRLGAEAFYDYVQQFGFGQLSGIGIGGEAEGHYRTPDMDIWSPVDLATNSFGQGISVTPLQMINAVSAIVNGGELMRPYIVQEVVAEDHREVTQPQVIRRVISEETSRTMRQLMNDVVDGVPGHLAQVAGYSVAGKTGTANIQDETSGQYSSTTIASFVGAVPADEPRFVMLIKIDGPRDDEFGSTVAAPIFARLAPPVLEYLKVPREDVPVAGEETPG